MTRSVGDLFKKKIKNEKNLEKRGEKGTLSALLSHYPKVFIHHWTALVVSRATEVIEKTNWVSHVSSNIITKQMIGNMSCSGGQSYI